jgi:hypothetical protein
MAGSTDHGEHLSQYLRQLTPQVRARLLAELERLHLIGEDIPHSESLIDALRAEFRNTGESHYRVGNPSRYFFEPLEPVLVDGAPERANNGQIARGSLGPIWSLVTERLLPSMADGYVASAKKAIVANNQAEARRLAEGFQNKVVTYLDGVLATDEGVATVRAGLEFYTSSHATFEGLRKMLRVMHGRQELAELARVLPAKIAALDGGGLARALDLLNGLRSRRAEMIPFALIVLARRLETPWQLIRLATQPAASKAVARIASMPYAIAVSIVLDQIDVKRLLLIDALRHNRMDRAKEILTEIYATDAAIRKRIELDGSDWGKRLDELMLAVDAVLDAEIRSIPSDHQHLLHTLEAFRLRMDRSSDGRLGQLMRKGRDVLTGWRRIAPV